MATGLNQHGIQMVESNDIERAKRELQLVVMAVLLGVFSFGSLLLAYHFADGDLWAKLAIGASVSIKGEIPRHDVFAFTPVLPIYVDHEWGAGTVFFGVLKYLGSPGLMGLKLVLFFGALAFAISAARREQGTHIASILLLAIPAAATLAPGFIPTIRSQVFTYFFFGALLWCLGEIRSGRNTRSAGIVTVLIVWLWSNLHGGFAAGLGTIGVFAAEALFFRRNARVLILVSLGAFGVTFLNPYGIEFWKQLLPALLHPRPLIGEWRPMTAWEIDAYTGFRILFVIAGLSIAFGWHQQPLEKRNWPGLAMVAITAILAWRSRRHAPFFGVAVLAVVAPYFEATLRSAIGGLAPKGKWNPYAALVGVYGLCALIAAGKFLPNASFQVLAPVGHDPVREADILSLAGAKGNLATPFAWGSYCAWRLHPDIKISHDGRYEAAYPESTFELNNAFFEKRGTNWTRLVKDHTVDFVLLDLQHELLKPEDLRPLGYQLVWLHEGVSALMSLEKHAPLLQKTVAALPPTTIDPLDPKIPERWWK
ncbi:MAG TPA: hypothetical protein VK968_17740 [Roseimicrobium sp.]|nr:hypothetical protein [Roseimicrobium sp.]